MLKDISYSENTSYIYFWVKKEDIYQTTVLQTMCIRCTILEKFKKLDGKALKIKKDLSTKDRAKTITLWNSNV